MELRHSGARGFCQVDASARRQAASAGLLGHNPFSGRYHDLGDNPYYPGGRDINGIDTLDAQLGRVYHRSVKLWLSEFTVSSGHANRAFSFAVSRPEQAEWLTAAFRLADSVNYVAGMGWFNLVDQAALPHRRNLTTGLLTYRLKPKPTTTHAGAHPDSTRH